MLAIHRESSNPVAEVSGQLLLGRNGGTASSDAGKDVNARPEEEEKFIVPVDHFRNIDGTADGHIAVVGVYASISEFILDGVAGGAGGRPVIAVVNGLLIPVVIPLKHAQGRPTLVGVGLPDRSVELVGAGFRGLGNPHA